MTATVTLPLDGGELELALVDPTDFGQPSAPIRSRTVLAAAHVVAKPDADQTGLPEAVDWDATMAYRHWLWSWGLGVAEAMDTSERGPDGLRWLAVQELIRRTLREADAVGATVVCGVGTDHLAPSPDVTHAQILAAYEEQCELVESHGGRCVLMASRALAATARDAQDYLEVYDHVLSQLGRPVILHWLGAVFDPQLAGYWAADGFEDALPTVLEIVRRHEAKVDGIKFSMLDDCYERALRAELPDGVRLYTGDDLNYLELMLEQDGRHSHALLGVLDAIAPAASAALQALDAGDEAGYRRALEATVPLARHLFSAPSYAYKTGLVLLAWLNGHQERFRMISGREDARSIEHLARTVVLADRAGLLRDPDLAAERANSLFARVIT